MSKIIKLPLCKRCGKEIESYETYCKKCMKKLINQCMANSIRSKF